MPKRNVYYAFNFLQEVSALCGKGKDTKKSVFQANLKVFLYHKTISSFLSVHQPSLSVKHSAPKSMCVMRYALIYLYVQLYIMCTYVPMCTHRYVIFQHLHIQQECID